MKINYTTDRSTQILVALLKAHGIKRVIASPGTTNAIFVASIQSDSFFEVFSCVDERSASYMACGMAYATNEPVVITCTEATASRNYLPGLTEAYYRKLPVLAITGTHGPYNIGNLFTQAIDRSQAPKDTVIYSTEIGHCNNEEDEWHVNLEINKAILALSKNGGGPVHINLAIAERWDFYSEELPNTRVIKRVKNRVDYPDLPSGKISIVIGCHHIFSSAENESIDKFCKNHNAVVFRDVIGGYRGDYGVPMGMLSMQKGYSSKVLSSDLRIHIGEIGWSVGDSKETWRISDDGELRDPFRNLTYLFEGSVSDFFDYYADKNVAQNDYYEESVNELTKALSLINNLPFSNLWLAFNTYNRFPKDCTIHFGILNSFRVWNMFPYDNSIETSCNFGGFGIDGCLSTVIGSSLTNNKRIHFCILGDLAFFYDLNSLANRHIGDNLRILLINNGKGNEFRNCIHPAYKLGEYADDFIAAAGHNGQKSPQLVKDFSENLGYHYLCARTKDEYLQVLDIFLSPSHSDKPFVLEVFTDGFDESDSLLSISTLLQGNASSLKDSVIKKAKDVLGDKGVASIKKMLGK